jgi:hypothetical protein
MCQKQLMCGVHPELFCLLLLFRGAGEEVALKLWSNHGRLPKDVVPHVLKNAG